MDATRTVGRGFSPPLRRTEQRIDDVLSYSTTFTRTRAWAIVALILAATGAADAATGTEAWFGPVYLLVICFSTWTLGWRVGVLVGFACAAATNLLNGADFYPLGQAAFVWNLLMRFLAVATIVVLIGSARRSYDREWRCARTDPLTGALNKVGFLEKLARERPDDQWLLLGYVDLDGLKRINDEDGHAAGDDVLRSFTRGVHESIRSTDSFARIGGDEFVICQAVASEEEACRLAHQLHARMNRLHSKLGQAIRCSMGALMIEPDAGGVTDAHIEWADGLMYEAKRQGAGLCIASRRAPASDKALCVRGQPARLLSKCASAE